ncbi:MAG: Crp/Fnr family transcriptional regulator [Anaerolineae bacterium]|nr:Crp/Fnr family transcriptional regulator [Anaerolineae bacterium]
MTMSTIEKVLFLKTVPLFEQLHSEELVGVAQIAHQVLIRANQTFVEQGDRSEALFIIVAGEANAVIKHVGQVSRVGPKSTIGDIAIVSDGPHSSSYVSTTDITALKIDYDDFWALMNEQPKISFGIIKVLVHHLNVVIEKLQMQQPSRRGLTNMPLDIWNALEQLS